jgi:hypothetical protein
VQHEQIDLRWGRLRLKSLAFAVPQGWKTTQTTIRMDDSSVNCTSALRDGRLEIELAHEVSLSKSNVLEVEIRPKSL